MSSYGVRISGGYQFFFAIIAGVTGAWFLIFLGNLLPTYYGFTPIVHKGEVLLMFAFFGLTFGFHLGRSITTGLQSFLFLSSAFTWVFLSLLVDFPPIFYGESEVDAVIALVIPALFGLSLTLSGILHSGTIAAKAFNMFCSKVTFYLFWIHMGYVYVHPMFAKFVSEPITAFSPSTFFVLIIGMGWVLMIFLIYAITERLTKMQDIISR